MIRFIGLTGPTGAGKGEAARILAEMGFYHLDCDRIYHELLIPPSRCLEEIRESFGDGVFSADGSLDRASLSKLVFSEEGRRERLPILNSITHKYVLSEARSRAEAAAGDGYRGFVMDAPVLFESGFDRECELVISILADRETRIKRIMERDHLKGREAAEARVNAQRSDEFYALRSHYVIYNNKGVKELREKLSEILRRAEL